MHIFGRFYTVVFFCGVVMVLLVSSSVRGAAAAAAADSVVFLTSPELVVRASRQSAGQASEIIIPSAVIELSDPENLADLTSLLPSTQLVVNSRGQSHFMMRGAPERQLTIELDGIPLKLPWDERCDLSLVPAAAIGRIRVTRGVAGVLDAPNTLAGTVALSTPTAARPRTIVSASFGTGNAVGVGVSRWDRRGEWGFLGAFSRVTRDSRALPSGYRTHDLQCFHQSESSLRTNSDREQNSLLLRAQRSIRTGGGVTILLACHDGSAGVSPETHLNDDARFWRYPVQQRVLAGCSFLLPLDEQANWRLSATASADMFRQEIRSYDDDSYTTPPLTPGVDFERDLERTGLVRMRLDGPLGPDAGMALQYTGRYAHHREILVVDGPELDYVQMLGSGVAEVNWQPTPDWEVRTGAGWETAATPLTGDKSARAATDDIVAHVRLAHRLGPGMHLHLAASRRSRFPSLRELFSGALGRFVPNVDLRPERQQLVEAGFSAQGQPWRTSVTGFASHLDGGIEKVVLPGPERQFMRVNRDRIRSFGLEFSGDWKPGDCVSLGARHTVLHTRADDGDGYVLSVEDRAAWMASVFADWTSERAGRGGGGWCGLKLRIEGVLLGPRQSADPTDIDDGLRRLPAWAQINLRCSWRCVAPWSEQSQAEVFLRLNNLLDEIALAQTGLPLPGRSLTGGIVVDFGRPS